MDEYDEPGVYDEEEDGLEELDEIERDGYEAGGYGGEHLRAAFEAGSSAQEVASASRRELVEAADALEQRFPALGDGDVQADVFEHLDSLRIDPGSPEGLEAIEEYCAARWLDRADDGDRIVDVATRTRFRQ